MDVVDKKLEQPKLEQVERSEAGETNPVVAGFRDIVSKAKAAEEESKDALEALDKSRQELAEALKPLSDNQRQEVYDLAEELMADPDLISYTAYLGPQQHKALLAYKNYAKFYARARETQSVETNLWHEGLRYFMREVYPHWDWEKFLSFCAYYDEKGFIRGFSAADHLIILTKILLAYENVRSRCAKVEGASFEDDFENSEDECENAVKLISEHLDEWLEWGFYDPSVGSESPNSTVGGRSLEDLKLVISDKLIDLTDAVTGVVSFKSSAWRANLSSPAFVDALYDLSWFEKLPSDASFLWALEDFLPDYIEHLKDIGLYPLGDIGREAFLERARAVGWVDLVPSIAGLDLLSPEDNRMELAEIINHHLNLVIPPYFLSKINLIRFVESLGVSEEFSNFDEQSNEPVDAIVAGFTRIITDYYGRLRWCEISIATLTEQVARNYFGVENFHEVLNEGNLAHPIYKSLVQAGTLRSTPSNEVDGTGDPTYVASSVVGSLYHEIGHVIYRSLDYDTLWELWCTSNDELNLNSYVEACRIKRFSLGVEEDFAASLSLFVKSPWFLYDISPERFNVILRIYRSYMDGPAFSRFMQHMISITESASEIFSSIEGDLESLVGRHEAYAVDYVSDEVRSHIRKCQSFLKRFR